MANTFFLANSLVQVHKHTIRAEANVQVCMTTIVYELLYVQWLEPDVINKHIINEQNGWATFICVPYDIWWQQYAYLFLQYYIPLYAVAVCSS